jgi:glutamyl/glutaminyl-tRNA synthetase
MTTRVRFAPSPTGTLHIGGARTALYNWLVARQSGGTFILRVEDTDLERSKAAYTDDILSSLEWLGIDWDEGPKRGGSNGPYYQTERMKAGLYKPFMDKLLAGGGVYRCFCSKERLAQLKAHNENAPYDGKCRSIAAAEAEKRFKAGEPSVVRIKLPTTGISWEDRIAGHVKWEAEHMSDEIIIRTDGSPMYNFVVVCDDIAMKVTDVIRGADHMANTPKQIPIYDALGAAKPRFAHIPLIFGPNGKKLSKRAPVMAGKNAKGEDVYVSASKEQPETHCDVLDGKGVRTTVPRGEVTDLRQVMSQVDEYRAAGYLPEAVVNYLVLLGWGSEDGKTEIFSKEELVSKFSIDKVSKSDAQFDPRKLEHFQGLYMRKLPDDVVAASFARELTKAGLYPESPSADDRAWLLLLARSEKERVRVFSDIVEKARVFRVDQLDYDAKARENLTKKAGVDALLAAYRADLEAQSFDDSKALEDRARAFAKEKGIKFGELVHPIRAALTGTTQGPGLFDVVRLCGKKKAIERLARAEEFARANAPKA